MISKRLRYEILRRDGHRCKYCGATSEEVKLTVDHVVPTALGGSDQPDNLVAACADCNAGKTSTSADAPLIDDVAQDALRWGRAMDMAARAERKRQERIDYAVATFAAAWSMDCPAPDDWMQSIETFLAAGLDTDDLVRFAEKAINNRKVTDYYTWKYFCGICWQTIKSRQEAATAIIDAGGAE